MAGKDQKRFEELTAMLLECQDRCIHTDLEYTCKEIRRILAQKEPGSKDYPVLLPLIEEARSEIRQNRLHSAAVRLDRILWISKNVGAGKAVGKNMGILNHLKAGIGKRESDSQKAMIEKEEKEAEQRVYDIEKQIARLYDDHSELTKQFERKVKTCSELDKDNNMYRQTKQQALALLPRIRSIEKQINMYAKMLETSSRYHAMIEMGKTTFDLQKFMPDISKAEAMMQWITEGAQETAENMSGLSSEIGKYEREIDSAASAEAFSGEDFDNLVLNEQKKTHSSSLEGEKAAGSAVKTDTHQADESRPERYQKQKEEGELS